MTTCPYRQAIAQNTNAKPILSLPIESAKYSLTDPNSVGLTPPPLHPMVEKADSRVIGLTGGIGTGKTTASQYLTKRYGLPVLDADLYAREAVQPGSNILAEIYNRYGTQIQRADGTLDRQALGRIVFGDAAERQWLETRIHPSVRQRLLEERTILAHEPLLVMAVPLLFEANLTDLVTEIWVVACSAMHQRQRLTQRDRLSQAEAEARIAAQMPLAEKCQRADRVLWNDQDPPALYQQIDQAMATLAP